MLEQKLQPTIGSLCHKAMTAAVVLFYRFSRSGARLSAALFASLLFLAFIFSDYFMGESSLSSFTKPLYNKWQPMNAENTTTDGGLRMVVFGTPDIAAVMGHDSPDQEKPWTEKLCQELQCSEYISYIPRINHTDLEGVDAALTSNVLWQHALDHINGEDFDRSVPGFDYSFVEDQYPLPNHPDLLDQVTSFVATPQPASKPKETLWVFNFGTWDIWYLAALPRDLAAHYVDSLVIRIFSQIEFLYQESLNERSIAFSDFWHHSSEDLIAKTRDRHADWTPNERESFRVLIPRLFDISITPGWHDARPVPPMPHNKAEQERNALFLTERWNEMITKQLDLWMRQPNPTNDDEYEDLVEAISRGQAAAAKSNAFIQDSLSASKSAKKNGNNNNNNNNKPVAAHHKRSTTNMVRKAGGQEAARSLVQITTEVEGRSTQQLDKQAAASIKMRQAKVQKRWRHTTHSDNGEAIVAPFPRRAAAQFDGQIFITEAIIEHQFRQRNISDHLGRGVRPDLDLAVFDQVWKPCVTDELAPAQQKRCKNPQDYLFYSLFTVNQRARDVIASRATRVAHEMLLLELPKKKHVSEQEQETENEEKRKEMESNRAQAEAERKHGRPVAGEVKAA